MVTSDSKVTGWLRRQSKHAIRGGNSRTAAYRIALGDGAETPWCRLLGRLAAPAEDSAAPKAPGPGLRLGTCQEGEERKGGMRASSVALLELARQGKSFALDT